MLDLNRPERRALRLGTALFVLGVAARLGFDPAPGGASWQPGPGGPSQSAGDVRAAVRMEMARAARAARPLAADERLDPNLAPLVELQRLPGVGPTRARAIVEARRTVAFRRLDDMRRVRGIGPATLRRMEPHLTFPAGTSPGWAPPGQNAAPPAGEGPLDLNRASAAELERLPGIGPELARRILDYRSRRGPFHRVDDLLAVPGIGARTLERVRPFVRAG